MNEKKYKSIPAYMIWDNVCNEPWGVTALKIFTDKGSANSILAEFPNVDIRVIHCDIVFIKP